ncbi:MAG: CBS domain-containing protein, partial [Verrucomicrobiota bacterium]
MSKHLPRHPARVFVAGHQRPDADTAVSAFVAARLKGALDPDREYQPILPGEANQQTRWIFERAGESLPAVHPDIRHTVGEGMSLDFISICEDAHLAEAVDLMHQSSGSLIPVVKQDGTLAGVLSDRLPQSRYFYNFNAEDYLGQLLHLQDVVSAIGLVPLRKKQTLLPSAPGTFRLGSVPATVARESWTADDVVLCGAQPEVVEIAAEKKVRAVIFADCDFSEAKTLVARHAALPAFHFSGSLMSLVSQLPMAIPVSIIMERNVARLSPDQLLEDVRELVAHTPHALPVVDEAGLLLGILTKVDMIEERKRLIILVDHFERNQSVRGIEQAEILEIIDHHRVGNIETMQPVRVDCRPVGSTASILAAQYAEAGLQPSRSESILLLGSLVSDTLLLTSPTTTPSDVALAKQLAKRARVNLQEFGRE